jgi:hypothetical protein
MTSPKARISLQLGKSSYSLGEDVEATLAVTSEEEFDAKEIRCEIQCVEDAKRMKYMFDSSVNRNVLKEARESSTLYSGKPVVGGPVHLTPGFQQAYPVKINIPAGGRPTFKSIDSTVTWTVKGVIAVDGRPDVTSSAAEIQVTQPSAAPVVKEKEVIREVVMIPCKYCGGLMPQTEIVCPHCGAKRTA